MGVIQFPTPPTSDINADPGAWQDYAFQLDEALKYFSSNIDETNYTGDHRDRISRMEGAAQEVGNILEALGYFASIKRVLQLVDVIDGKSTIWYTLEEPADKNTGDVWYDRSVTPTKIMRWTGTMWDDITDYALAAALERAADARAIADLKIRTYYQTEEPAGLLEADAGDLWIDSNDGNVIYRWSGSAWVLIQDIQNYVYQDANGVNIKSSDGRFRAVVSSTALAFYEQDAWIAEFSNNRLNTNKVEAVNGVTLGSSIKGFYDFISGIDTLTIDYREG